MTLENQIVTEKSLFHQSNCISDIKFFDNLIGWTLANARDATLEYKSSLFQRHPDARDATLARASYCEPGLTSC